MKILTAEQQTQALENILMELQLAASRISDEMFKKMGAKNLMIAIQDAKNLLELSRDLSVYEQIAQYSDIDQGYSDSLGIHNQL